MTSLPQALVPLSSYKQFILWKTINGRKIPFNPETLEAASSTNPSHWSDADTVFSVANELPEFHVGFVFTEQDPFWFLDIDKCYENGAWSPLATELMGSLPGAAVEVSQSGRGLHIFGTGAVAEHARKNTALHIELYTSERFVALTGNTSTNGSAAADLTSQINAIAKVYFPPKITDGKVDGWTTEPVPEWTKLTDEQILEKAMKPRSLAATVFGAQSATFQDLWDANEDVLGKVYPAQGGDAFDRSSADSALAMHLAFWSGRNCETVRRLMLKSALVREKWTERSDYLYLTITNAVKASSSVYQRPQLEDTPPPPHEVAEFTLTAGPQYMPADQQMEFFKGCVYVTSENKIRNPIGEMLSQERFNAVYGGYAFQIKDDGKTTDKAWIAFTNSQVLRTIVVSGQQFRPDLEEGVVFKDEVDGRSYVNSYRPAFPAAREGDVSPFLTHLAKMIPDPTDQTLLLSYMAACVQYPGVKFSWAPVIQGTHGNGKSTITKVMERVIGSRYFYSGRQVEILSQFNSWAETALFAVFDDVHITRDVDSHMTELKKMVTDKSQLVIRKGVDGEMRRVYYNMLFTCNEEDAIPVDQNERRFAFFHSAQQERSDLERDGMTGEYFYHLQNWIDGEGSAAMAHFLRTYRIPDGFNPATTLVNAPTTSTSARTRENAGGPLVHAIRNAIEEGGTGFEGGWVSTYWLQEALDRLGFKRVHGRKINRALAWLGYTPHPALPDQNGRVNSPLRTDNRRRPRLFIRKDAELPPMTAAEAAAAYESAQVAFQIGASDGGLEG
jgi:hypothetical protein